MKTFDYEGRKFWQVTDRSAIRCHKKDRLEIITMNEAGEVVYKSRTVSPYMFNTVKAMFAREGIV